MHLTKTTFDRDDVRDTIAAEIRSIRRDSRGRHRSSYPAVYVQGVIEGLQTMAHGRFARPRPNGCNW